MRHEVKLPDLGEDAADTATVSVWLVAADDMVSEGDELLELTTDKASSCMSSGISWPAPSSRCRRFRFRSS